MGQFKVEITASGAHGCQREIGDGGTVFGCRKQTCPDCRVREFVEDLKRRYQVEAATFTHWPETPQEVVDDLLTKKRVGSF